MVSKLDNADFFSSLRRVLKTRFNAEQVVAIIHILKECDNEGITDKNMVAYVLATSWHESRFRSISEIRAKPNSQIWKWQNRYWPSGFYGRGLPQLTWYRNYKYFSKIVGIDLVKHPDRVLEPAIGAKILVHGMFHGKFSGVALSKFFPKNGTPDWIGARKIVNGTFQADRVAADSVKFLSAIVENKEYLC